MKHKASPILEALYSTRDIKPSFVLISPHGEKRTREEDLVTLVAQRRKVQGLSNGIGRQIGSNSSDLFTDLLAGFVRSDR